MASTKSTAGARKPERVLARAFALTLPSPCGFKSRWILFQSDLLLCFVAFFYRHMFVFVCVSVGLVYFFFFFFFPAKFCCEHVCWLLTRCTNSRKQTAVKNSLSRHQMVQAFALCKIILFFVVVWNLILCQTFEQSTDSKAVRRPRSPMLWAFRPKTLWKR